MRLHYDAHLFSATPRFNVYSTMLRQNKCDYCSPTIRSKYSCDIGDVVQINTPLGVCSSLEDEQNDTRLCQETKRITYIQIQNIYLLYISDTSQNTSDYKRLDYKWLWIKVTLIRDHLYSIVL